MVLKWPAIFVKDLSMVPVRVNPTGRPRLQIMEVDINTVRSVIAEDRHVFVRQHLSRMTIHQILMQELKMRRACSIILFFVVM